MSKIVLRSQELDSAIGPMHNGRTAGNPAIRERVTTVRDKLALRSETPTLDLLIDVATRHYLRGSSQIEIARDLSLDPSTISRYLKRARDEGIVRIEIVPPRRANVEMARILAREVGLSRVLVAELQGERDDYLSAVASVAAQLTADQL